MIYTIGHTVSYRQYMNEYGEDCKKLGKGTYKGEDYPGGCVWQTADEAKEYLTSHKLTEYSVWEVSADWDSDTEINITEPYRNLLHTSQIVREIP